MGVETEHSGRGYWVGVAWRVGGKDRVLWVWSLWGRGLGGGWGLTVWISLEAGPVVGVA